MKEYRCEKCNKLLFKGDIKEGKIEIKCKCKELVIFDISKKK